MNRTRSLASFLAVSAALLLGITAFAGNTTVLVTGDTSAGENQPGWMFNRDPGTSTPIEFNEDEASIGVGSLYVLPIGANPPDKFIGEYFLNEAIADLDSFTYDFQIGSAGNPGDANQFYLNVYTNFGESDDFKFYDCRYDVIPVVGSNGSFTTVTFDPTLAYPVTTRGGASASPYACPAVPAEMDLLSPGSNVRAFALNVGDTAAGDVGLDGYLDNVVLTLDGMSTTFNFDPALTPETKDDCKKGGWQTFNSPTFKNQGQCVSFVNHNGG